MANEFVVKNGLIVSGSTNVSGSVTAFSFTGSFSGSFTGSGTVASASFATSASYALSASFAVSASRAVSSSFATSASYALSASFAVSASRAVSSSYALQATSASYVSGTLVSPGSTTQILFNSGGLVGTDTRFVFSGSRLGVNTSAPFATAHITQYDPTLPALPAGYQFLIDQLGQYLVDSASNYLVGADPVNYASASFIVDSLPFTNVIFVSGNRVGINTGLATEALDVIGNVKAYNFLGTASYALAGLSSSYATTASYVLQAVSASYALSSSYAEQAISASYAVSSSYAEQATSASYVSGSIVAPGQTTYLTYNSGGILEGNPDLVYSGSKFGIGTNNPQALTHIYQTESPFDAPIVPGIELIDFDGDYLMTEDGIGLVGDDGLYPNSSLKVDSTTNNNVLYVSGSRIGVNTGNPNANLDINGNVIVSGSLTVSGSSTFRNIGPAEFTGSFRNIGPAEFTGSLNVSGSDVTISSPVISLSSPVVYVTGSLELSNQLILTSPFNVGALNFGNAGLIQGGSGINNDIRIGYGFGGFIYSAKFSGTDGNLILPRGLIASGSTNISGSTTIRGNTTVTGSLNVSGSTNIIGTTNITGSLNVNGPITNNGVNIQALSIAYAVALG
jgi:hypothetical protein